MSDGEKQVLCLAEKINGNWGMVLANSAALRQDTALTSLLLDTDETLFWTYSPDEATTESYHAVRQDGQWRVAGMMSSEIHANGNISEYHLSYSDGRLQYSTYFCDENENILESDEYEPVPAAWVDGLLPLISYDDARFPKPNQYYTHSWLSEEATAKAAAELFPEDTFLGGCAERDHLAFFLERPNGEKIIACCRFDENKGWRITRSTPLPSDTTYGFENFSSSLVIGDLLVNVGPVDENTFGVTYIYNTADNVSGTCMFSLGRNWITDEVPNGYDNRFGDHPWGDIAVIDWNSLPHTMEEALETLDTSGWAVVNNPDPADRLHLRVKPERGAKSLGKYYNGTPVRILEKKGDWVRADIFGITGWMMKDYLAFGAAGHAVEAAFPARMPVEHQVDHFVYAQPEEAQPVFNSRHQQHSLVVLGIVGDEWYHVWFPQNGMSGYVLQSDWWEGNG